MAIPQNLKRRSMDAISHPETSSHVRAFRGAGLTKPGITQAKPAVVESRGLDLHHMKRMAMNAISHVETVAQIGWVRVAAAAAVYTAHVRQVDRAQREPKREWSPRPFSEAEHTYGRE